MKKKYLIFPLLAASLGSFGQKPDTSYVKKKLIKTDVQLLFSYYTQDGSHSAVTGGLGTEKLKVFGPEILVTKQIDSVKLWNYEIGMDVISSASTDKIDFVMSSASKIDTRTHSRLGYGRVIRNSGYTLVGSAGFSVESDYFSLGFGISLNHKNKSQSKELSIDFQTYFDDLRWGWLTHFKPVTLIYPEELRNRKWYNENKRKSFNLNVGFYQTINQRMALGIYPGILYQHGLLATPFHRVFFNDSSLRVENVPSDKIRIPLGFQLNAFVSNKWILRNYYRFYWDNFGIIANTINFEAAVKLNPFFTLTPYFRFYTQTKSKYFKPYRQHAPNEKYYVSDYDLSSFSSFSPGLGLKLATKQQTQFKEFELRYSFYKRTNNLSAHILSMLVYLSYLKSKEK